MSDGPDEIYDTVPEDFKNEMAGDEEEEGIFEDIYDIPPGQFEKGREREGGREGRKERGREREDSWRESTILCGDIKHVYST